MPLYCYSTQDGRIEERFHPMGEAPDFVCLVDGAVALRDFAAEHRPRRAGAGWPFSCVASGVHPEQAGELREFFKKHGESVDVTSEGDPVYTSPSQRKRLLKLRGFYDKSGY